MKFSVFFAFVVSTHAIHNTFQEPCDPPLDMSVSNMNKEMDHFSKTLDKTHYDNAMKISKATGAPLPAIDTHSHYKDSFGKVDEVKNYDSTEGHLDEIKHWQDNLNSNPTNGLHVKRFIDRVKAVRNEVTNKYPSDVF